MFQWNEEKWSVSFSEPEVLKTKEAISTRMYENLRNLQQSERGKAGRRSPTESTWWSSYFTPMFVIVCLFSFFLYTYIYKTCLYFSTDRGTYREEAANAWNWWKESVLVQFFCLFYSERSSWTSCGRREPTPLLSEGLMGNNDCVINMADRYCYQPFF